MRIGSRRRSGRRRFLAAQEEDEKEKKQGEGRARGPLPEGEFLPPWSACSRRRRYFALGLLQIKGQEETKEPDLELAKYNIDMLQTPWGKDPRVILTEQEKAVLEKTLNDLRMGYVQVAG